MNAIDIRTALISNLTVMLSPPSRIETPKQAQAYLSALAEAFVQMRPTDGEWEHIWAEFLRTWDKAYWPLPSELPRRLSAFRVQCASVAKAAGLVEHAPAASGRQEPAYHHGEFMAALATARRNAAEKRPGWEAFDRAILRMGEALLRNRDDHDRPRYPEAAE